MGLLGRLWAGAVVLAGCVPELAADLSRVDAARVLAVRAEPAEAGPGELVTLTALYADAEGAVAEAGLRWALCTARRPLAELGPVARVCLADKNASLLALGTGVSVTAELPTDVCRLFGPEPPAATDGQPAGRPVDPDPSGGYYQPIRVASDGEISLVQLRSACGLAGATQQQAAEFRRRYQANLAPRVAELGRVDGAPLGEGEVLSAGAGEEVALRVGWAACPEAAKCGDGVCTLDEGADSCAGDCGDIVGCGGAETYLRLDPVGLTLVEQREAIRVAWYATAGSFEQASTGRGAQERVASSDNVWVAPEEAGAATLWVVLRDDRGGTSWREVAVLVQ